jgi:hypothetical protein
MRLLGRVFRRFRPLEVFGLAFMIVFGLYEITASLVVLPLLPSQFALPLFALLGVGLYGYRVIADAHGGVSFRSPSRIEYRVWVSIPGSDKMRWGAAHLYRIALHCHRSEDTIQLEGQVVPMVTKRDVFHPAVASQNEEPTGLAPGSRSITLRHGQRAFIDLVRIQEQDDGSFACLLPDTQPNFSQISGSKQTYYQTGLRLPAGKYEITLKVLYSDRAHDEKTYRLDVDAEESEVKVTPLRI